MVCYVVRSCIYNIVVYDKFPHKSLIFAFLDERQNPYSSKYIPYSQHLFFLFMNMGNSYLKQFFALGVYDSGSTRIYTVRVS